MNPIYFAIALISLIGVTSVNAQCDKGPPEWKRPEECCKFQLIESSVFQACHSEKHGEHGNGEKPPHKGTPHPHGHGSKGSCRIECAFNKTGLYDGKQLNENQIRKVFTAAVNGNAELLTTLNSALDKCIPLTKSRSAEFTAAVAKGEKCSPITQFLFMCVTGNMVAKCPAADFQSKDATCVAIQKFMIQCPNGPTSPN